MSNLEHKLRNLPFRAPPASLRRDILAAPAKSGRVSKWREWLWPSPLAWSAVAALWAVLLWINAATLPATPESSGQQPGEPAPGSLWAFHTSRDLSAILESLN